MPLPIVNFTSDEKKIAKDLNDFLDEDNPFNNLFKKTVYDFHPTLKHQLAKKQKKDQLKIIYDYVTIFCQKHKKELTFTKNILKENWEVIMHDIFQKLTNILNTDWNGINTINCTVGIVPLYPRNLKTFTCGVYFNNHYFRSLAVILHEITHFIYFKKWHELFPKDKDYTFEAPHSYWHLSEILAPIINNNDSIRKLIPDAEIQSYDIYTSTPVTQKNSAVSIQGYFVQKYLDFNAKGKTIEDYLKFARTKITKIEIPDNFNDLL